MAEDVQYDVFLSYSFKDQPMAEQLDERLRADGLSVWFAPRNCPIGADIQSLIEEGLNASELCIQCMSKKARDSETDWLKFELSIARTSDLLGRTGRVIPLLIEDFELPKSWKTRHFIDFREDFETAYSILIEHCKKVLSGQEEAIPNVSDTASDKISSRRSENFEKRRTMFPRLARPEYLK